MTTCTCEHRQEIARSDQITVSHCKCCDRYWLTTRDGVTWLAPVVMSMLCEIIKAQSRFVPKAVTS